MYNFNDRAKGIFIDGYHDKNGLPVGDVFAYRLRAALYGRQSKDWPTVRIGEIVQALTSGEMNILFEYFIARDNEGSISQEEREIGLLKAGAVADLLLDADLYFIEHKQLEHRYEEVLKDCKEAVVSLTISGIRADGSEGCRVEEIPDFYSVYARLDDGTSLRIADFSLTGKADDFAIKMAAQLSVPFLGNEASMRADYSTNLARDSGLGIC